MNYTVFASETNAAQLSTPSQLALKKANLMLLRLTGVTSDVLEYGVSSDRAFLVELERLTGLKVQWSSEEWHHETISALYPEIRRKFKRGRRSRVARLEAQLFLRTCIKQKLVVRFD